MEHIRRPGSSRAAAIVNGRCGITLDAYRTRTRRKSLSVPRASEVNEMKTGHRPPLLVNEIPVSGEQSPA